MKKQMILLGMLMAFCMAEAKVTLPALFTDNMVLQQKSNVIFHGHSSTKKEVIIKTGWNKHPYTTSPDKEGNWKIEVPTPSAGGPYEIIISDGDEHILQNILIGEIWLYTGECETETPIDIPSQPYIRLFQTKKEISLVPKKDLHATQEGWKECTSETITGLPAIGYFFASQLQKNLKVPIGIISCTWKDTPAEAWASYDALENLPSYNKETEMLESLGFNPEKIEAEYGALLSVRAIFITALPYKDIIKLFTNTIWDGAMTTKYGRNLIIRMKTGKQWNFRDTGKIRE